MNFTKSLGAALMLCLAVTVTAHDDPQMHRRLVAVRLRGRVASSNSVAELNDMPMPR